MKTNEMKSTRFIPAPKEVVFKYWTDPRLIEQWAYPEGLTLKLPKFEAKTGGRYRYEHTGKEGVFVCEGKIKELVPNEKLVQLDEYIKSPDGKTLAENLESTITFEDALGGTDITVVMKGNLNEKFVGECEAGWNQSLDHLNDLIVKESGARTKGKFPETRPNI